MSDEAKALVERLRDGVLYGDARLHNPKGHNPLFRECADLIETQAREIERLREELADAYVKLSGKSIHTSDCATSNAPAMEPGPCNCDAPGDADLIDKLRDTDSYYRIQEKHWCIDGEELERQRLAAAALIETQAAELAKFKELAEALAGAVREIKDSWDWWQVDTYDRCSSVVEDAINEALRKYKEARDV